MTNSSALILERMRQMGW